MANSANPNELKLEDYGRSYISFYCDATHKSLSIESFYGALPYSEEEDKTISFDFDEERGRKLYEFLKERYEK